MGLCNYKPEGWIIDTPENRAAMTNLSTLMDAMKKKFWKAELLFATARII